MRGRIVDEKGNDVTAKLLKSYPVWHNWGSEKAYKEWVSKMADTMVGPNSSYAKSQKGKE